MGRCKPGCDCKKCELDRLADARQRALCVELRRAAGRDEGYRQVMRKAKVYAAQEVSVSSFHGERVAKHGARREELL